ncbi:hypothetical protein KXV85_005896, partial [Aspergillus fumigatus]
LGRPHLDHWKALRGQMRADRIDQTVDPGADHETQLQHGIGMAGNGVGGLLDVAGRHRQHFERVPRRKTFGRRQAFLAPVFGERRLVRGRHHLDVGEIAADLVGEPRRLQRVEQEAAVAVDQRGDRVHQDGRGIGEHAAPIAGM